MSRHRFVVMIALLVLDVAWMSTARAEIVDVRPLAEQLRAVKPKGEGHREASSAWRKLSHAEAEQLPEVLAGMKGAGPLAENWFRAAVEAIAQRHLRESGELPLDILEEFLTDTDQSPRARRLAYELIANVDESAEQRLIPSLMNDPSLELRRDAIALAFAGAAELEENGQLGEAAAAYQRIFTASRSLDQIKQASSKLRELDQTVDIPGHMGYVMKWHLAGPFDNRQGKGFDAVYAPEQQVDLKAKYNGKLGEVGWIEFATEEAYGIVDLNVAFERPKQGNSYQLTDAHKEAVAYAFAEFFSDRERDVDLRLGCINANKIWLNGELLTANEVYHAGMEIDQYLAKGRLKAGRNTVLVKLCQNEQTEDWAQRWQFQLRVCDHLGTAVLSSDRAGRREAAGGGR